MHFSAIHKTDIILQTIFDCTLFPSFLLFVVRNMSEENSMGFDLPNENSVNLFDFDVEGYFSSQFEDSFPPNLGVCLLRMPMHIPSTLLHDVLMALERNEVEKCQLISILFRVFIDNSARLLPKRTGSSIRFSYNEILFHFEWLADSGAFDHQDRGINKEFYVSTEDMNEIITGKVRSFLTLRGLVTKVYFAVKI
jgi:hypothetical protein